MKRILYVHHAGGIGGAPLSLLFLLQKLDRSRFEPMVITLKPGPVVDLYRGEGIETQVEPRISDFSHTELEWYGGRDLWRLPIKVARILPSLGQMRRLLRQLQPDLVHLNSSTLAYLTSACHRENIPCVLHIREPITQGYLGLRRSWLRRVIARNASEVVAISQHDANQLILKSNVHVIHNFVDFNSFDRHLDGGAVREALGIDPAQAIITMLGGVAEPKGTLTLIKALPELVQAVPEVKVLIAGPPPKALSEPGLKGLIKKFIGVDAYQKTVQREISALPADAQEALIFTGIRRDIPQILAASQALVFPSVVPHFARPVIEAAAMGVPAVASNLGGPRELIIPDQTGLLIPPNDPSALAIALVDLLRNPQWAAQLGEAAYQRARQMFDSNSNAQATFAVYVRIFDNLA
ncbi:MAG: glycosyltransferase family 4 protein [Chloroflexi bacterium]|nr:glycosyltransferase family 4 protein [Chloroflexota bacterium]